MPKVRSVCNRGLPAGPATVPGSPARSSLPSRDGLNVFQMKEAGFCGAVQQHNNKMLRGSKCVVSTEGHRIECGGFVVIDERPLDVEVREDPHPPRLPYAAQLNVLSNLTKPFLFLRR